MPFLNEITSFINQTLKDGSLNKPRLQPAKYFGLTTVIGRKKSSSQKELEQLPSVIAPNRKIIPITPDSKLAIQVYHKLLGNTYRKETKSYGDGHYIRCVSDMAMVVIANSKMTGKANNALESAIVFGIPQRLSTALQMDLNINSCQIIPVSSNLESIQVFRQEYPQSEYFLNDQVGIFSIRYKCELIFSQACVNACLCEDDPADPNLNIITEDGQNILAEAGDNLIIE